MGFGMDIGERRERVCGLWTGRNGSMRIATWQNWQGGLPDALPSRVSVAATVHERNDTLAVCGWYLG